MEIPYLKWKKDDAVNYYQGLIDHAKKLMLPVPPIDHDQRPKDMTVDELLHELTKRGQTDIRNKVLEIVNERDREIDLFEKCQDMITKYNYGNYDKVKELLSYKKVK